MLGWQLKGIYLGLMDFGQNGDSRGGPLSLPWNIKIVVSEDLILKYDIRKSWQIFSKLDLFLWYLNSPCKSGNAIVVGRKISFLLENVFRFLIHVSDLSHGSSENTPGWLLGFICLHSLLQVEDSYQRSHLMKHCRYAIILVIKQYSSP